MNLPRRFAIGEWAVCPEGGFTCDAPFQVDGSDAVELQPILGQSLPENEESPAGQWRLWVSASCPHCGVQLEAIALSEARALHQFMLA